MTKTTVGGGRTAPRADQYTKKKLSKPAGPGLAVSRWTWCGAATAMTMLKKCAVISRPPVPMALTAHADTPATNTRRLHARARTVAVPMTTTHTRTHHGGPTTGAIVVTVSALLGATFSGMRRQLIHLLGRRSKYDSDSDYDSRSPPPRRERRKSIGEQALGALGLSGAAAAILGKDKERDRGRSPSRSRSRARGDRRHSSSSSRSRTRGKSVDGRKKIEQAAKAAVTAGVIEAWRSRKEPGGLGGQGKRILTAAVGAAGVNGAIDNDPEKHSTRHTIEAAIGGLAGNRLINGPREGSRSRSRSRGRGNKEEGPGVGGVASAAALAGLAGKAFNDYRSKSRKRGGDDRRADSDDDDYYGAGRRRGRDDDYDDRRGSRAGGRPDGPMRKRSQSVSEFVTRHVDKGLAAVGLGDSEHHKPEYAKDKYGRRRLEDSNDDDYVARPRGGGGAEEADHSDGTDSYSSENEQKKLKSIGKKEYLTAGLATVATVHAVHGVHQSMEKRKMRHQKVMEGKMSPAEARKLKSRALMQDAASVGIAALGIKGAMSEWKEVTEKRREVRTKKLRLEEMREHRRQKLLRNDSHHSSEPNLGGRYYDDEPRYNDGNPYASSALPPPPMGDRR